MPSVFPREATWSTRTLTHLSRQTTVKKLKELGIPPKYPVSHGSEFKLAVTAAATITAVTNNIGGIITILIIIITFGHL